MDTSHSPAPTLFESSGSQASPRRSSGRNPSAVSRGSSSLDPLPPTNQNGRGDQPSGTDSLPHLVDIPALAEHLGVTPRHVRRLVAERRIPFVRWGQLIRFDPEEIVAWLERARVPGNEGA